jgi:hypothetical protein
MHMGSLGHSITTELNLNSWRRMRRAAHGSLNQSAATQYFRFQQAESVLLASGLLAEPDLWHDHLRR